MPRGTPDTKWLLYKDVAINAYFYQYGILIFLPRQLLTSPHQKALEKRVSSTFFTLKNRRFYVSDANAKSEEASSNSSKAQVKQPRKRNLEESWYLLANALHLTQTELPSFYVFNENRREEVFWPIKLTEDRGIYLYAWTASPKDLTQAWDFRTIVTAGCLFGGNLQAVIERLNARFPLIKHDLPLQPDDQIIAISYDQQSHSPYEEIFFKNLQQLIHFTKRYLPQGEPLEFVYHLPYYDYMLLGVQLFISKKMTLEALGMLILNIIEKRLEHINKINSLFSLLDELQITLKIESPLINIFGPIEGIVSTDGWVSSPEHDVEKLATIFLNALNISPDAECQITEEELLAICKFKLQHNTFDPAFAEVWRDIKIGEDTQIRTIEELFEVANALVVASASANKAPGSVCSWLPIGEKAIAASYDAQRRKLNANVQSSVDKPRVKYPATFNATLLDVTAHSLPLDDKSGVTFYYQDESQRTLAKMVDKIPLLESASRNICEYLENKTPFSLSEVLASGVKYTSYPGTLLSPAPTSSASSSSNSSAVLTSKTLLSPGSTVSKLGIERSY